MAIGLLATRFPGDLADPWLLPKEAERLGFESLWAGEHMVVPQTTDATSPYHSHGVPASPAALPRLAGAAAVTSSIRIGTSVLLVPQHHPVLLAKQLATLDADSGGRLLVGVGIGWNPEEARIMGAQWERRVTQCREAVEVMRALWTGEFVEHHGELYDFPPMATRPRPAQEPYPPILIGMNHERGIDRAARYGNGWLPGISRGSSIRDGGLDYIARGRERLDALCEKAGRDPEDVPISVILADDQGVDIDRGLIEQYTAAGAVRVILLGIFGQDQRFESERDAVGWLESIAERVLP
jgi:probable F420-dependent oxidoreductase